MSSGPWQPRTRAEREAARDQLARLLASPLFRTSRRVVELLRFTVEYALGSDGEHLKERTLGIRVFNRDPHYDTNLDPVVRMTAVEIRKRLAQYYREPGHETEIHIDFPPGSYEPAFSRPDAAGTAAGGPVPDAPLPPRRSRRRTVAAAFLLCSPLAAIAGWMLLPRETALDDFWGPIFKSGVPVLVCIPGSQPRGLEQHAAGRSGGPDRAADPRTNAANLIEVDHVRFGDALALSMLTAFLQSRGTQFRVRRGEATTLDDLRDGPTILLGPGRWSDHLTGPLRFSVIRDGPIRYVRDRQDPTARKWWLETTPGAPNPTQDYALVSRVLDYTTGRVSVTASGFFPSGTRAAAEFLTNPACMEDALRLAPGDWKHKNIQLVISAPVLGENSGQPHVVAAHLW
jgi:hypothetical protein